MNEKGFTVKKITVLCVGFTVTVLSMAFLGVTNEYGVVGLGVYNAILMMWGAALID